MTRTWILEPLTPFGLIVRAVEQGADLSGLPIRQLEDWVNEHRLILLRRFAPLKEQELPAFCRTLGELVEWDFGTVNDLRVKADAKNYLYTNRAVPFHWDGAFRDRSPHFIFFHCDAAPAPGAGGETLFCDTVRLLARTPVELQELWERVVITYTTEKIVHYGGSFSAPMIASHPISHERVLRYAEPVEDLNPVRLNISGVSHERRPAFLEDLHGRLHDESCCYAHEWHEGDVVIADNYALLHGRRAFSRNAERHIRRVNIL
jgi:alpha-ketoglutarate-dependent taurine dioxygenase